ncbi:DUF4282 domain-containing protein [candidate division WOR-3 bacterium]|jgi:hypothetical protein|nr:DUF4282 domain-containing protein [candidate division WOR-3 bacterium]
MEKGFFTQLFDFSFTEFITTKIIKFIYILGMIVTGLATIGIIISGFSQSVVIGIVALIFSPLIFIIYVIILRVWLEIIIVIFRISENTELLKGKE